MRVPVIGKGKAGDVQGKTRVKEGGNGGWQWAMGNGTGNVQGHTCLRGRAVGLLGGLRLTSSRGFSCSPHDDDDILYSGAGRPGWTGLGVWGAW